MRERVVSYIQRANSKMSFTELQDTVQNFILYAPVGFETMYSWWRAYSDRNLLPFTGGIAEQPAWVWRDFGVFSQVEAWIDNKRSAVESARSEG